MSPNAGEQQLALERRPLWLLGVVLSTMVGMLFYMAASLSIENDASDLFNNLARSARQSIETRVQAYGNLLRGADRLFRASKHVSREQFHSYVEKLESPTK